VKEHILTIWVIREIIFTPSCTIIFRSCKYSKQLRLLASNRELIATLIEVKHDSIVCGQWESMTDATAFCGNRIKNKKREIKRKEQKGRDKREEATI